MKARAVKDKEFTSKRQLMSGFHEGYDCHEVWRFEIDMATQPVRSTKTYETKKEAEAAGKRFVAKLLD